MSNLKKFFRIREFPLIIINIVIILILSLKFPNFATINNFFNIMYSVSINIFIICALTVLIISGVFDIAVGVTLGLSGIVVAKMLVVFHFPIPLAILIAVAVGALIGFVEGYLVAYLKMNPFIVTIGAFFIVGTLRLLVSGGSMVSGLPEEFQLITSYKILNIPILIIISFLTLIIFDILLRKNIFFRFSYAIGANENASYLFGIRHKKVKIFYYILVGAMSAVAGIFLTSRLTAAYLESGANTPFEVIAAIVIGGASLKGGRGSIVGSFLGLILMVLLTQMLVFFKVNMLWEKVLIGFMLILVLIIDSVSRRGRLALSKSL